MEEALGKLLDRLRETIPRAKIDPGEPRGNPPPKKSHPMVQMKLKKNWVGESDSAIFGLRPGRCPVEKVKGCVPIRTLARPIRGALDTPRRLTA